MRPDSQNADASGAISEPDEERLLRVSTTGDIWASLSGRGGGCAKGSRLPEVGTSQERRPLRVSHASLREYSKAYRWSLFMIAAESSS